MSMKIWVKVLVIGMLVMAIGTPVFSGNVKATEGSNDQHVPHTWVIVRKGYGSEVGGYTINQEIGNAAQDDKFGVVIVAHIEGYDYWPNAYDDVKLSVTGMGVKGENAGDYKIKWFEIGGTKFSFEGKNSEITPHATDYTTGLASVAVPSVVVGLRGSVEHSEVDWFADIAGDVAGTATAAIVDTASGGTAGPLAGLLGDGVNYLVNTAIHRAFNVNNAGRNYKGSDTNPWAEDATYPHTFMALRGVTDGATDDPDKVLVGKKFDWQLHDGINDRVHVLTLKATLCYAKYGWHAVGYGWYDEHTISTSVTIYVAPQSMVRTIGTKGGQPIYDLKIWDSDPAYSDSYFLNVVRDNFDNTYTYSMPAEDSSTTQRSDSSSDKIISLFTGATFDRDDLDDTYYYYRGALPLGDSKDCYRVDFPHNLEYSENYAHIWIYTSEDIQVKINYCGNIQILTLRGGHSVDISHYMQSNAWAYITISKINSQSAPHYIISAFVEYSGYNGDNGGSGGGGYHPPGDPNHPPIPTGYYPTAEQTF